MRNWSGCASRASKSATSSRSLDVGAQRSSDRRTSARTSATPSSRTSPSMISPPTRPVAPTTRTLRVTEGHLVFLLDHVEAPATAGLLLALSEPRRDVQARRRVERDDRPEDDRGVAGGAAIRDRVAEQRRTETVAAGLRIDEKPAQLGDVLLERGIE